MNTTTKSMAVAMLAVAMAISPNFDNKTAMIIAYKMNINKTIANEMMKDLSLAKAVAENDMGDEFSTYTWTDLEYLYDDLEEELFSCKDRMREAEIGNLLDKIESAMRKIESGNDNFRA